MKTQSDFMKKNQKPDTQSTENRIIHGLTINKKQ